MNAKDKRYVAFVENHRFWASVFDDHFTPDRLWDVVAQRGLPPEIQEGWRISELQHERHISAVNRENGREGGKTGGRGRPKEK